jgi:hypothetical protein
MRKTGALKAVLGAMSLFACLSSGAVAHPTVAVSSVSGLDTQLQPVGYYSYYGHDHQNCYRPHYRGYSNYYYNHDSYYRGSSRYYGGRDSYYSYSYRPYSYYYRPDYYRRHYYSDY